MAAPKGILALLASPKAKGSSGSSPPLREPGDPASSPLGAKAEALKSFWSNMKANEWEAAAMDFQDAYDACAEGHEEDDDEEGPLYEEGETDEEI